MKRLFKRNLLALFAAVLFCVSSAAIVSADSADPGVYYENVDRMVTVQATDGTGYLYLRFGPGMNYDIMENIYDGTVLHISAVCQDYDGIMWGQTQYDGRYGWVSMQHTVPYTAPEDVDETAVDYYVAVKAIDGSDYLYLRSGPSRGNQVICNIYDDTKLHITAESQDAEGLVWGKTEYNGQTGWVSLKYTVSWESYVSDNSEASVHSDTQETTQPAEQTATPEPVKETTKEPAQETEKETPVKSEEDADVKEHVDSAPENNNMKQNTVNSFDQKLMTAVIVVVVIVAAAAIVLVILLKKNKH